MQWLFIHKDTVVSSFLLSYFLSENINCNSNSFAIHILTKDAILDLLNSGNLLKKMAHSTQKTWFMVLYWTLPLADSNIRRPWSTGNWRTHKPSYYISMEFSRFLFISNGGNMYSEFIEMWPFHYNINLLHI